MSDSPIAILVDSSGSFIGVPGNPLITNSSGSNQSVTGSVNITNSVLTITGSTLSLPFGTQTVTGSVSITAPVAVSSLPNITGSVNVTNTLFNVTGTMGISSPVTSQVTGTVNLDRGNTAALPLFVSGAMIVTFPAVQTVTGSVAITTMPNVTGSVNVTNIRFPVTGTVNLDRGNISSLPLFVSGAMTVTFPAVQTVTGSVGITNQVAVTTTGSFPVVVSSLPSITGSVNVTNQLFNVTGSVGVVGVVREVKGTSAACTNVVAAAADTQLLAANANRVGATIFNDSTAILYLKFGTGASTTSYTVQIGKNTYYEVPFDYQGAINGYWSSAAGTARVTEVT